MLQRTYSARSFQGKMGYHSTGYSNIRDHIGKANTTLDVFLHVVCPAIRIISVEEHFEKMKWRM